jgi:hypothetical protein
MSSPNLPKLSLAEPNPALPGPPGGRSPQRAETARVPGGVIGCGQPEFRVWRWDAWPPGRDWPRVRECSLETSLG